MKMARVKTRRPLVGADPCRWSLEDFGSLFQGPPWREPLALGPDEERSALRRTDQSSFFFPLPRLSLSLQLVPRRVAIGEFRPLPTALLRRPTVSHPPRS